MFKLRLLGAASIEGPEGPLSGRVAQGRQLALLAVLALRGDRPTGRDKLLALFWPDADTDSARHNLADCVYLIRKALGDDAVRSLADDVLLDGERVRSDVGEFEAALERGELERAVEAYGGPLLDGFHLSGSREFEGWLERERARLARDYSRALRGLAESQEAADDWEDAVEWWRRAVDLEPSNSGFVLRLMRALVASGDRVGAIRRAETHTVLLREEYEVEPDPDLLALADELRRGAEPAAADGSAHERGSGVDDAGPREAEAAPDGRSAGPRRPPGRTPGRGFAGWAALVAFLVVTAGVYIGMASGESPGPGDGSTGSLDAGATAIVPFRIAGADARLAYLREGMVDLLAAKLTGESGLLAALEPSTALSAWRNAVEDERLDLPRADAIELAGDLGAGSLIVGSVVGTPANLELHASIVDVRTGEERGTGSVQGSEGSLYELVDRLVAQLLSRSAGEEEHRLAHLTSTSLPALRAFLAARAAHRRGDYTTALRRYGRALELDSTFALAGLGVLQVDGWVGGSGPAAARALNVARRYRDRLSERDRVGLAGRIAPRDPNRPPSVAERLEAVEEALRRWPDHPMLWYRRGDLLMHWGAGLGVESWARHSRTSLERAIELDPDYAEPVHHLAVVLRVMGDTAALRALASRQLARAPTGPTADYLRWQAHHVFGQASPFGRPALEPMDTDATLRWIGLVAQDAGFAIADGARAVRLRLGRPGIRDARLERRMGAFSYALNRGRPTEALAVLESLPEARPSRYFRHLHLRLALLTAMYADGDERAAVSAAGRLARVEAGGAYAELNACILAQWRLYADDRGLAVPPEPDSKELPSTTVKAGPWASHRAICAAVLHAQRTAEAGAASHRAALDRLESLLAMGRHTGLVDSGHTEYAHLALARLYEADGGPAAARAALRRRAFYDGWQPYLATMLRAEGRLAAALGDTAEAIRAYEHYLAFRTDPERSLRDEVERVREELSSLAR